MSDNAVRTCRDCGVEKECLDGRCADCWARTVSGAGIEMIRDAMEEHPTTRAIMQLGRDWFRGREARLKSEKKKE